MVVTLGQKYDVGEKPTVIMYTCCCTYVLVYCSTIQYAVVGAVLRGHQKVDFRRQIRTTFDVKNSTHFTFYIGHSTRQGASNRITHDVQPHTSQQLHSVQQLTLIFAIVRYFEYCFQKPIAAPRWTPAGRCSAAVSTHHVAAILE